MSNKPGPFQRKLFGNGQDTQYDGYINFHNKDNPWTGKKSIKNNIFLWFFHNTDPIRVNKFLKNRNKS